MESSVIVIENKSPSRGRVRERGRGRRDGPPRRSRFLQPVKPGAAGGRHRDGVIGNIGNRIPEGRRDLIRPFQQILYDRCFCSLQHLALIRTIPLRFQAICHTLHVYQKDRIFLVQKDQSTIKFHDDCNIMVNRLLSI